MPFKLFNCPEVLLARRTTGLHDLVLRAHERIQIVALYFFSYSAQEFRLLHLPTLVDNGSYLFQSFLEYQPHVEPNSHIYTLISPKAVLGVNGCIQWDGKISI